LLDWGSVKIVFSDVDGVLTDGAVYFGPEGQVFKRFNIYDGYGMRKLVEAGVKVIIISADDTPIVTARASRLQVSEVHMGVRDKATKVRDILAREGLADVEAVFLGDDELDVPAMNVVGIAVSVPSAHPCALAAADFVTQRRGGEGAMREVCDLILAAREGHEVCP
jgi:3-deoxy-D-manno-octulosonate 8-phosphate phosphatase (KDO 8-P phosphatase)